MTSITGSEPGGRSLLLYAAALGILLLGFAVAQVLKLLLRRGHFEEEGGGLRPLIGGTFRSLILPALYVVSLYFSVTVLALPERFQRIADTVALVALIWFAVRFSTHAMHIGFTRWFERRGSESARLRIRPLLAIGDVLLWILAVIFLLDNLGFKISSIVAGLGIGGITVALASQAVLGDLFSYLVILFDRPFELGDFIIAGDVMGVIEAIGIKTTKVRSLNGELIVIANSQLTSSKIHNYKHMERRRIVFTLSVTFDTPPFRLEEIPGLVRLAVEGQEGATFDRAHFKSIGQSSLDFEIVYYVENADYLRYMDIQQAINLALVSSFTERDIAFAFPTMTVDLARNGAAL